MNRIKSSLVLTIAILCITSVLQVKGVTPDFETVAEQYQWNSNMKRLRITTPERGLTFKITISNEDASESITIQDMELDVRVYFGTEEYTKFFKQVSIDYIHLPPSEESVIFVPVDFGHGDIVGDYRAELTCNARYTGQQKIEPFPFQFRVLSEDMFQQEIEQSGDGGITINIPIEIQIGGPVITVSIVAIAIYLWKRKKD